MIRVIFFDLMDTVLYDPYREAILAATGCDLQTLRTVRRAELWPQFELGEIDEEYLVRHFFNEPESHLRFDASRFHETRLQCVRFIDGMEDLLNDLYGVRLCIASNYPVWIDGLVQHFHLRKIFSEVYVSCRLKVRKPDERFFDKLLEEEQISAEHAFFVDDRIENCAAAIRRGIQAHHFHHASVLRQRLCEIGLMCKHG